MRTFLPCLLLLAACGEEATPPPAPDMIPPADPLPPMETMALSDTSWAAKGAGSDAGGIADFDPAALATLD